MHENIVKASLLKDKRQNQMCMQREALKRTYSSETSVSEVWPFMSLTICELLPFPHFPHKSPLCLSWLRWVLFFAKTEGYNKKTTTTLPGY